MPKIKFEYDDEYALDKLNYELDKLTKIEQAQIKMATGIDDQYIRNMLQEGDSRQPLSLPAIILFARALKKPVEYFLYEETIFVDLFKENFISLPYVKAYTDKNNSLITKDGKNMCVVRYNSIRKIVKEPEKIVFFAVNTDTMEPTLNRGDELLIDTGDKYNIEDGRIYIFNTFEFKAIRIRRILMLVDKLELIADNKRKYESCTASLKEINILGKVVLSKNFFGKNYMPESKYD